MKSLVHLSYGEQVPDCTRCTRDQRLRTEFGCDEPAWRPCRCYGTDPGCEHCHGTGRMLHPVFFVSCSSCGGDGCGRCGTDDGWVAVYRCPKKLVEDRPDVVRAYNACRQYLDHGALPVAGGTTNQTAQFMIALRIFQHEHGLIMEERRRQAEAQAKRAEAAAKRRR